MQYAIVGFLLDGDGRQLARGLVGVAAAVLMALLLAVAIPITFLGGGAAARVSGSSGSGPGASGAGGSGVTVSVGGSSGMATPSGPPRPDQAPPSVSPPASTGGQLVDVGRRYLGVPYVFGGSNPTSGLDCSGLVQLVFRQLAISLPRTAQLQYAATERVPQDQLQPGDLVFFARTYADPHDWITHVGIYIGGGMQINAPTEGQVVSIQPVFSGFWGAHYAGAGRAHGA